MLLNLLFISTAFAGKLATGLFGVPWSEPPAAPPMSSCRLQANGWLPVDVTYVVEYGVLHSVFVTARSTRECETVRATYDAAWGDLVPVSPYRTAWTEDHLWRDGDVAAIWQFNRYSYLCTILAMHQGNNTVVQEAKKHGAAQAAGGL